MRKSPMLRTLAVAMSGVLLVACTVGPAHVRPTLDLPEAFARADARSQASHPTPAVAATVDAAFWEALAEPQLSALVERSLRANHDLRIALARHDADAALLRGARHDQLPGLRAEALVTDQRLASDQAPGRSRGQRDSRGHGLAATASWELDLFGRVRRDIESRRADAAASAADLRSVQVSLVADVVSAYLELRGLQARLRVAEANAHSQQETLRLIERGLDAGRGTAFDSARASALFESTSARIPAFQAQIAFTVHRLSVLSGQPPEALIVELELPRPLPALPPPLDPGTPGELLRRRPDIAAAEARLHAGTARVGVATADLFPRFTLSGLLGTHASARDALFGRDSETRLVALGIDWSFLDVGRVRARIAAANAEASGELARYEQTVLLALEDTENALVAYANARVEDAHLQRAATDSERAAALARGRLAAGAGTLLDALDAERSQLQAQDALAQSRSRSLGAWVGLYRTMAGGWRERLPAVVTTRGHETLDP